MDDPKTSNGTHKGGAAEAPANAGLTGTGKAEAAAFSSPDPKPAEASSAAGKPGSAESASSTGARPARITGRPAREEGDEESRSARGRAAQELWAIADGHPLRTYSFGTVVTAGLLGFALGRLFTR